MRHSHPSEALQEVSSLLDRLGQKRHMLALGESRSKVHTKESDAFSSANSRVTDLQGVTLPPGFF